MTPIKLLLSFAIVIGTLNAHSAETYQEWTFEKNTVNDQIYCSASTTSFSDRGVQAKLQFILPSEEGQLPFVEIELFQSEISGLAIKGAVGSTDRSSASYDFFAKEPSLENSDKQILHLPLWVFVQLFDDFISDRSFVAEIIFDNDEASDNILFSLFGATKTMTKIHSDCLFNENKAQISRPITLDQLLTDSQKSFLEIFSQQAVEIELNDNKSLAEFYFLSESLQQNTQLAFAENQQLVVFGEEIALAQPVLEEEREKLRSEQIDLQARESELSQMNLSRTSLEQEGAELIENMTNLEARLPNLEVIKNQKEETFQSVRSNYQPYLEEDLRLTRLLSEKQTNLDTIVQALAKNEGFQEEHDLGITNIESSMNSKSIHLSTLNRELDLSLDDLSEVKESLDAFDRGRWLNRSGINRRGRVFLNRERRDRRDGDITYQQINKQLKDLAKSRADLSGRQRKVDRRLQELPIEIEKLAGSLRALENKKSVSLKQQEKIPNQIASLEKQKQENLNRHNVFSDRFNQNKIKKDEHLYVIGEQCNPARDGLTEFDCAEKNRLVAELTKKMNSDDKKAKQLIAQRNKIETQISNLKQTSKNLPSMIEELKGEIKKTQQKLQAKKVSLAGYKKEKSTNAYGLRELKEQIAVKREQKVRVENAVDDAYFEIEARYIQIDSEVLQLENDVFEYQQELRALGKEKENLLDQLRELQLQKSAFEGRKTILISEVESARSQKRALDQDPKFQQTRSQFEQAQKEKDQALSNYNVTNEKLIQSKARQEQIFTILSAYQSREPNLQAEITDSKLYIDILNESITSKDQALQQLLVGQEDLSQVLIVQVQSLKKLNQQLVNNLNGVVLG